MPDNGTTSERNPLASKLAARSIVDVDGVTAHWRCRVLSPTEAVELQAGLSMLQAAVEDARKTKGRGRKKTADPTPTPQQQIALVQHMEALACAVVMESSESGKTWHPIRLVNTIEQQDVEADPPRVYIGTIDPADLGTIAFAATSTYREARDAAATFRSESDAPARTRRRRKALQPNAG